MFRKKILVYFILGLLIFFSGCKEKDNTAVNMNAASGLTFVDTDPTKGEIAGDLKITNTSFEGDLTHYAVYWGSGRTLKLSSQPRISLLEKIGDKLSVNFPKNTKIPEGASHFLVYTQNEGEEMGSGVYIGIDDFAIPQEKAANISFANNSPTLGELSGTVLISKATDESAITHYTLYWGTDSTTKYEGDGELAKLEKTGNDLQFVFSEASLPSGFFTVAADNRIPEGVTYILVYTKNNDGEMEEGINISFTQQSAKVVNVTVTHLGANQSVTLKNDYIDVFAQIASEEKIISGNGSFSFDNHVLLENAFSLSIVTEPDTGNCLLSDHTSDSILVDHTAILKCVELVGGNLIGRDLSLTPDLTSDINQNLTGFPINGPIQAITTDGNNLYIAANNSIQTIDSSQEVTTLFPIDSSADIIDMVYENGYLYVVDQARKNIWRVSTPGGVKESLNSIPLFDPRGITSDGDKLYVTDNTTDGLVSINLNGLAYEKFGFEYTALQSRLRQITTDNIYLYATTSDNKIQKLMKNGQVGPLSPFGCSDAACSEFDASPDTPQSIATDGFNLYVTFAGSNKIHRINNDDGSNDTVLVTSGLSGPVGLIATKNSLIVVDAPTQLISLP